MHARWLSLALSVLGTGCFGTHGVGGGDRDGGARPPPPPPPMCELYGASVDALRCPGTVMAGEPAVLTFTTSPSVCCSDGTVRSTYVREGYTHRFALEWDACDCCDACRCVGPIAEETVVTAPLEAGRHTVRIEGASCVVEAIAPSECGPAWGATDFRAPSHLLEDQPFPVTLTSTPGGGCGCIPRVVGAEALGYAMELCDCCDECECVDEGYQASHVRDPLPVGDHAVGVPHGETRVTVHARAECYEIEATALELVGPRRDLLIGGPALAWARVTGEETVCCATPTPVVERLDTTGTGIALRLLSCVREDCFCEPPAPVSASTWVSLGELAPGTHEVRIGALSQTITLP